MHHLTITILYNFQLRHKTLKTILIVVLLSQNQETIVGIMLTRFSQFKYLLSEEACVTVETHFLNFLGQSVSSKQMI